MTGEICDAIQAKGIHAPPEIIIDGKIHRFPTNGKRGDRAGYYSFWDHGGGFVSGFWGDWRSGFQQIWHSKQGLELSLADRQRVECQIKEARQAADREREAKAKEAAEKAKEMLGEAKEATADHPYLTMKQVKPYGIKQAGDVLMVPVMDKRGAIHGLQRIFPDGKKRFLSGTPIKGHFFQIGTGTPFYICEGYATGASVYEATGKTVICAFNAGNLLSVAKVIRELNPTEKIVLCADNDQWTKDNPGLTKATEAGQAIGGFLVTPKFKDTSTHPTDFNDLATLEGVEAVQEQLRRAKRIEQPENDEVILTRLASLSPLEYDRIREKKAETLNIRVSTLDQEVKKRRPNGEDDNGRRVIVEELEPWSEPVDGAEILREIRSLVKAHVIIDDASSITACALWCLLTYCYDAFRILPLLAVTSPEKRCGKTRLLEVLQGLVNRAKSTSNISPAAIYRVVESYSPCLLIDEADTFTKDNDALRGIINSGHTRDSAHVTRLNKDTLEVEEFSTWGPKVIAMIGQLPDTNRDRAISIRLKRKTRGEKVAHLPLDFKNEQETLRRKSMRWAVDNFESLKATNPDVPEVGNDRAQDNWIPLFAIAELAGGEWPGAVHQAMLSMEGEADNDTIRQELLADIRSVFDVDGRERIASKDLVERLVGMEDRPWGEWKRGKPLRQNGLARLLKPFGISSKTIRLDGKTPRGYEKVQFMDAFDRYLPPFQSATMPQVNNGAGFPSFSKCNKKENVADEKTRKVNNDEGCCGVAVQNPEKGKERVYNKEIDLFDNDAVVI